MELYDACIPNIQRSGLVILLKQGDITAFTVLHKRYYGLLYAHAYKRLPDREEVRDILQDIFTWIWNNKYEIDFNTSFAAYLYTALRNRILNVHKHHQVRSDYVTSLHEFFEGGQPAADEMVRLKELVALIETEVAGLPPQMRLIFELSRNANLSHKEIAQQLNITSLTVRKQVNNSLKILRIKLGTYFYFVF